MNKQEAIEKLQSEARHHCGEKECYKDGCTKNVELDIAIDIINQLDELEKPILPQFVADWLEVCKENLALSLAGSMNPHILRTNNQSEKTIHWLAENQETFAKAWIYGYEIEKEKFYRMKHKLTGEYLCFTFNKSFHSDDLNWYTAIKRTHKEWEDMGYWNNHLYEPEEVEE